MTEIKQLTWQEVLPVRHQVLWPDRPPEFCRVNADDKAKHYGVYIHENLVSVASVYLEPKATSVRLRKFATVVEYQNRGIGSQLLRHVLFEVRQTSVSEFWCDARINAIGLYEKFGMQADGKEFIKSGLPYIKMILKL